VERSQTSIQGACRKVFWFIEDDFGIATRGQSCHARR
jgi:hypothetical protein